MAGDEILDRFNARAPGPDLPFVLEDEVEVTAGIYAGKRGAVVQLAYAESPMEYLVDFGDGTAAGGSWATDPPSALEHTYLFSDFEQKNYITLTLTVIDATGQGDTATLTLGLVALIAT